MYACLNASSESEQTWGFKKKKEKMNLSKSETKKITEAKLYTSEKSLIPNFKKRTQMLEKWDGQDSYMPILLSF